MTPTIEDMECTVGVHGDSHILFGMLNFDIWDDSQYSGYIYDVKAYKIKKLGGRFLTHPIDYIMSTPSLYYAGVCANFEDAKAKYWDAIDRIELIILEEAA